MNAIERESRRQLLRSGNWSDLTLKCGGERMKVHCAVVCSRSKVLAAAVDGPFKESFTREIEMSDDELPVVQAMLHYIYVGDYDDEIESQATPASSVSKQLSQAKPEILVIPTNASHAIETDGPKPILAASEITSRQDTSLLFNIKVYIIGDKYDIPDLKAVATKKFEESAAGDWDSSVFIDALELLWENTMASDRLLKEAVIVAAVPHIDNLLKQQEFEEFMATHADFSLEILKCVLVDRPIKIQGAAPKGVQKNISRDLTPSGPRNSPNGASTTHPSNRSLPTNKRRKNTHMN